MLLGSANVGCKSLPSRSANLACATGLAKLPMGALLIVRVACDSASRDMPLGGGALHVSTGWWLDACCVDVSGSQDAWVRALDEFGRQT